MPCHAVLQVGSGGVLRLMGLGVGVGLDDTYVSSIQLVKDGPAGTFIA